MSTLAQGVAAVMPSLIVCYCGNWVHTGFHSQLSIPNSLVLVLQLTHHHLTQKLLPKGPLRYRLSLLQPCSTQLRKLLLSWKPLWGSLQAVASGPMPLQPRPPAFLGTCHHQVKSDFHLCCSLSKVHNALPLLKSSLRKHHKPPNLRKTSMICK